MYTIKRHLNYNAWATGQITGFLSGLEESNFDSELKSSFPTLRKTIMHIWDAEQIWLMRITGEAPQGWPSANFIGNTTDMLQGWSLTSKDLALFVSDKDRAFLEGVIRYKNMQGKEFAQPVEDILFHVVNHGSYHRGQLVTMLRHLGFSKFPAQDLIAYIRLGE